MLLMVSRPPESRQGGYDEHPAKELIRALVRTARPRLVAEILNILRGPRWPRAKVELIRAEIHWTAVDIVWLTFLARRTLEPQRPRPPERAPTGGLSQLPPHGLVRRPPR